MFAKPDLVILDAAGTDARERKCRRRMYFRR